jgi:hypothetical protein
MVLKMLSKRWLINCLLIVLIAVFTYVGIRYQQKTAYAPKNSITGLKPQNIHTATIQAADKRFVLSKSGNQWLLEKPVQWPANNITVERLISIVTSESDSRLPAEGVDLATLGLQIPKAILSLNDTRILFGATNNIGGRRYIKVGSTVYLLPDIHLHFINQGIRGLIDRRLLPRSIPLKSLKLAELSLSKDSNGTWQGDAVGEVELNRLNQIVNNWQTLDAGGVKIYDKSKMPGQKMVARLEDGGEIDFFLMSIKPEIVIARPDLGVQYHFAEKQYYDLFSIADKDP